MLSQSRSWYVRFLGQSSQRRRQHSSVAVKKYRRRAFLEALESRQVLTAPLPSDLPPFPVPQPDNPGARIWEGYLYISAADSPAHDNQLKISTDDAGTIFIRDEALAWESTGQIPGAALSPDGHTLIVPGGTITGQQILINGGGGNDNLTLDFSGGNPIPLGGLKFNGGGQTSETGDEITLTNGEVQSVDYIFINENDGSITVDGRTVDYVGLEPITDTLVAGNRTLTYTGPSETITIDDNVAGDGLTRINSTSAELVNITAPSAQLTIVAGGSDTTLINSFDAGFNTPLISLQGSGGANAFNLGAANVIPDATGLSLSGDANFSLNGFAETIASLASADATTTLTLTTGQVLTAGDGANTTFAGVITGAGGLTKVGAGTLLLSGASPLFSGTSTVNGGTLQIDQANSSGTGPTVINSTGTFAINNVTHNAAVALNNGGTLLGMGTAARENGVVTIAASAAAGVTLAATAGSTLTLGDAANDLTGGAGTTITINGGGIVFPSQSSNAGTAANPVKWKVIGGSSLQISTDAQFGTAPTAATPAFLTLDNGTLRNATTASITMNANRGITLGAGGANFFNATTTNITFAGLISGAFPLNVVGTTGAAGGALILSGAAVNQFTSLNIDNSEVFLSNASTANSLGTGPINITNNGQFNYLNSASSITIPNAINMASGTTIASRAVGGNSLTLAGVVTLPTSGTVRFDTEATANGPINMTNPANAVALTGDLTIQVGPTVGTEAQVNLNHLISGSSGIIKTQPGILQLTNNGNTYTGPTQFNGGSVLVPSLALVNGGGTPSPLGAGANVATSLQFGGGFLRYSGGDFTFNRNYTVNAGIGGFDVSTAATVLSLSGSGTGAGGLSKAGPGTLRLLANSSDYTGTGTVVEGTLQLGANNALPVASSLTVGSGTTVGTFDMATFDQTLAGLGANSNSTSNNVITVNPGHTLTVNGNVAITNNTDNASTNLVMNGGGSLAVTGATFFVGQNAGGTNISSNASLDLTALAAFNATMSTSLVVQQQGDNDATHVATLRLSNTANTITAPTVTVGASATAGINQLLLGGGTNVINTNTLNIGTGGRDSGSITFSGASGTLRVRNQAGTGAAAFNMGTGGATTGVNGANTFDVTAHNADLLFGAAAIATQSRNSVFTNTFSFDTGTLTMTSLAMGTVGGDTAANGTGPRTQTATMNLGGGAVNITNGITNFGSIGGTGYTDATKPRNVTANLNISGGTVNIGATGGNSVTMATLNVTGTTNTAALSSTANINLTGGTTTFAGNIIRGAFGGTSTGGTTATANLNVNGGAVNFSAKTVGTAALPISLTFAGGTISNLANTNGGANLVKSTAAGGVITGTNALPGTTVGSAGPLYINGSIGPLTIDPGASFSPGTTATNVGQANVTGNYAQNGTLSIQISSPNSDVPGTDYDQVKVVGGGTVSIGAAATLSVSYTGTPSTFAGNTGQLYVLIDNDGTDPINQFTGLNEGATITVDGMAMRLSYVGGDGNDVTLSAVGGPPPIIYIDDDFTGTTVDGNSETAGVQSATLGVDAFTAISGPSSALAMYPNFTGIMYINGGTYSAASFAGGSSVSIRLLQDIGNSEFDVTLQNLTGDADDLIATRFLGAANANLIVEQGTYAGVISGAGNFTKSGTGTLILSGANTYTGSTNIADGTLQLGVDNALPTTTAVSIGGLGSPVVPTPVTSTGTFNLGAFNQTLASLNSTANSTTPNVVTIGAGKTLTLTAGMSLGLSSTNAATGQSPTDTVLNVTGAGTLSIAGTTINVGVNSTGTNFSHHSRAVLDVSGLGNFTTNVTNFNIGVGSATVPMATVNLSNTANTILATTMTISDTGANNGNGQVIVTLGTGTNVLQVDTLNIGRGKNIGGAGAVLKFASQVAGSPGTVSIANKAGTGAANIQIANNNGTATAGGAVGTLDLRGHVATVSAGTVTMSNLTMTSSTGGTNGTLSFDAGTFTIATLNMAPKTAAGTGTATSTVNVGGGTFTVNAALNMGSQATAGAAVATINVTGGTFITNANIVKGAGAVTSTVNLSGGTLEMNGKTLGTAAAPIVLNFTGGTLQNLAEYNDGDVVVKTGTGAATLAGNNAYTGPTLVHQGVLTINSNNALGSGANVSGMAPIGLFVQQWQAGVDNNANTEMSQESGTSNAAPGSATARDDDWYFAGTYPAPIGVLAADEALGGAPATGFERALVQTDPIDRIHFNLAATEIDDNFQLLIDLVSSDFTGGSIPIEVLVNGVSVHTQIISANGLVTTPVFTGTAVNMTAGDNVVTVQRTTGAGTGNWVQFDFIRLNRQTLIPAVNTQVEPGATLAFTGGIAVPESLVVSGTGAAGQGGAIVSSTGANSVAGTVSLLANSTINVTAGSLALNGVVSGPVAVTKAGAGTLTLAGADTYTGATTVTAGTLAVTGSLVSAPTVQTGATLTGTGTTGVLTVDAGATHAPGTNVGTGTVTGNYVQNGALQIQIGSPSGSTAGTDYDQVKVLGTGSVNLGAASSLAVIYTGTPGTFNPTVGQTYVIIDNDGTTPADTVGTFAGLAEGATISVDGKSLVIQYHGGDGNDIVLVTVAPVLYVNDQFTAAAGTPVGDADLETAGNQPAVIGTTAFVSIAAALAGPNSGFSGAIVVNGGTYATATLASGGNVTLRLVQDGVSEPNVVFGDLSGDAGDAIITRFNGVANANLTVAQGSFSGVISGAGAVTKSTAGTLELLGTNTYTGPTTVSAGTLRVTGSTAASATTVLSGATLTGAGTTGAVTVNSGGVHQPGVGTAVGFANVQGNYVNNGGLTLEISSIGGTTAGTDFDQVRVTSSGSVALGGTLTVNYTGAPGTFNPTTGAIYKIIDNDGTAAADTTGTFSGLPEGSIITVDGRGMQIQYHAGDGNDVVLVAQAPIVALYVDNGFTAANGTVVDGDLEQAGPQNAVIGTSAFASVGEALAANPGYAGIIIVNGGTYPTGAALAGGGNVTLRLVRDLTNSEPDVTFNSLSGDAGDQIITRFNNAANANLIVTSGAFSGVISGTGDVIKSGSGTVTLSGANTYSGLTDVQAGVLTISNAAALGATTGATNVASGGQLQLSGGIVVGGESVTIAGQGGNSQGALNNLSGNNEWAGPIVIAAGGNNRVGSTAGNFTLSGPISGGQAGVNGGLTVRNGAGVTIVSGGANTYLGDTTVVVGTLRLAGGANRLPVGTKLAIGNTAGVTPASFDLGGQNQTVAGLYHITPAGPMLIEVTNSGALSTLTVDIASGTDIYGGVITGAVNLTKSGAGVLALATVGGNNSNTHTGTTLVSGGRLHLNKTAGQNAIPGALQITTGGLVTFGANDQIADTASVSVSDAGSVFNGTAFNAGQLPNLQETIGSLTVTGGTFQTGSGANWNIGTAMFTGGAGNTIFLGNSGSSATFGGLTLNAMTQTPGGTVQTANSFAIYGGGPAVGTIAVGSGGLALNGSVFNLRRGTAGSRLVLDGDVIATGTSSIIVDPGSGSGGIAQVELSGTAGAANRTFDVTAGGTLTVSALITDGAATPGSLTKAGVGTLVLSGANTYTGTTSANAGVLQLAGGSAVLDTAGAVNVGLGGTLQLLANETVSSYAGAGDIGAGTNDSTLALGAFMLTTTGAAALGNVTGSAGAAIVAGTSITDADDDNNITAPNIALTAAAGIGTSGDPIEATVANLEASGGSGGVFVENTGDLVIGGIGALVGVSATGGSINVSTSGSLTVNESVTGTGAVTLSAGDNATLSGNVSSGTTTTVNVDATGTDPGVGGVLTLTGTITAPGGATLNGGNDNDTFNLKPQTAAAVTVNGFDPQMTTTGDVLNLDLTGAVNQQLALGSIGSGVWTFAAPLQTVSYTSIEAMNANAPYHLALDASAAAFGNTGVPDLITVRQSGANLIVERTGSPLAPDNDDVGVIFQGAIAAIQSFTYIGSSDADVLTISDVGGLPQFGSTAPGIPDNTNLAGVGSILFDGNGGADDVNFNLTGANAALTYAIGSGNGTASTEGEVRVTSGVLSLQAYVVDTELIERTGTGATPGALSIIGDSGANAIAVTASGANTLVSAPGYTALSFSGNNFSALTIDGLGNSDTIELVSLGTGQTNNPPITLSGGAGDDTLRVHSTSGNTGPVTLNGNAGSDLFVLQSATSTVDGIVGPVIVDGNDGIVANNDDRLTIVDSGDTTGDNVFVNAVNPATSSDYRVEGITSTTGDDVIFRNIDTLSYTGTSGGDTIDAQFVNTTPAHDLAVVTLNGWTGGDQFYLFTSDQIGGTSPTPAGTPSGLASITLNGDAPGNPNAGDGNDIFGQTPPGLSGTGAGDAGLAVPDTVRSIRPSASTAITINGGQPTAPVGTPGDSVGDVLNLDTSGLPPTSSLVLATLSGQLAGAGIEPLNYAQIEDLNYITNHQLLNLQLGDTLVQATSGPDTVIFSKNPTPAMPNGVRVRMGTLIVDFPMNGKTLTYSGDGNDYVTHSNVTFPMEIHGEGGDDMLFGGTGNDLLIGGLGNDQINASAGDNILFGDNEPTSVDPTPQNSAVGGNDILSSLGGADVIYGGGGDDQVSPGAGNDYVYGGEGNDILDGYAGDDRVYGGGGNDVISGSEGHDLLSGGAGNDQLFGRDGNDVLIGGDGVDTLDGGAGDDLLIGGNVANQLSSWTSTTNGTTFGANLYSRPADNDAALLALLTAWSSTNNRTTLATITDDGLLDLIWGSTGNDDFSSTPGEAQDRNSPSMGTDESF